MHKHENSQVLPALEELKRRVEGSSLGGHQRLELLMTLGYFEKQRLCELDRRDPEELVGRTWLGFERRFGGLPVVEDFKTHPGWLSLRAFFRPPPSAPRRRGTPPLRWQSLWVSGTFPDQYPRLERPA